MIMKQNSHLINFFVFSIVCAITSVASAIPLTQSKSEWPQAASRDGFYSGPASSACHTLTTDYHSNIKHKPQTHFNI